MAVLVTGGAGYIGSHMVLALLDADEQDLVLDTLRRHQVEAIAHFAAKIVVPDSVADPLGYYLNNTVKSRALIESAVKGGVKQFIFSSTAAVYGEPSVVPVPEDLPLNPINPYGRSKLMTEWMLQDAAGAHDLRYVALRYFNVAGADPRGRSGQSTPNATHLIKVAAQTALGDRPYIEVFGTDYPTPDGSCLRDYIQVSDLVDAHLVALNHLRRGGASLTLNCGYGRGYSVLEVIDVVKKVSGVDFPVRISPRRPDDPCRIVRPAESARSWVGGRATTTSTASSIRRSPGSERSRLGT